MNIELMALLALNLTADFMSSEASIYNAVALAETRPPTRSEVATALRMLERNAEVVGVSNRDTGTRWQIADAGKARLVKAGL